MPGRKPRKNIMNWKFFANLAVGFLESAGIAKVNEDPNDTGLDDITGDSLIFAAKIVRWVIAGANPETKPKAPASLA